MKPSGSRSWMRPELVRAALAEAARALEPVSDTARLDAELLMAHALGTSREQLLLTRLDDPTPDRFADLVARRLDHEPVAYITGTRAFWTIDLHVGPGVLIPRPDSETLLEAAVAHFADRAPTRILDLGTGPGTLLLAALAEWPEAHGLGVDSSERALEYAARNAMALGMEQRVRFQLGDWTAGLEGPFDLILANPPYIATDEELPAEVSAYEPHSALFAGADGLDAYRRIVPDLARLLAPGGIAMLELGWTQAESVFSLARTAGLSAVLKYDMGGRPRALAVS
jgi:release factor glutamine methyltransferase